jgi:hypothetical protein
MKSEPVLVQMPHRFGKEEELRGQKKWLGNVRTNFGHLLSVDEETWNGDHLTFRVRSLGQSAAGTIEVFEDQVRLEVTLPWLLAKLTERLVPAIRKEGTLLLGKK